MPQANLCSAIKSRNLVRFYYTGDNEQGYRTVEPHMVAYNSANHLALSAWWLSGASESTEGQWWREYLLNDISDVIVLPQTFSGPRHGYRRDGGHEIS